MNNIKITNLDETTTPTLSGVTVIVDGGTTYKTTLQSIKNTITSATKEILVFPVPTSDGDLIQVEVTATDTIIKFENQLTTGFTLDVIAGPNTTEGDRVYFFGNPANTGVTITFAGDLNNVVCGNLDNQYDLGNFGEGPGGGFQEGTRGILFVYDGNEFTGLDNC